jgi:hypothetical protein
MSFNKKTPSHLRVFNIEQCEGIPKEKIPPVIERNNNPIESCEKIIMKCPNDLKSGIRINKPITISQKILSICPKLKLLKTVKVITELFFMNFMPISA